MWTWLQTEEFQWRKYIKSTVFWHVTPYNLTVHHNFGGVCYLHLQGWRVIQAYKQAASWRRWRQVYSSEMWVNFYRTTRYQTPADSTFHSHHHEYMTSHKEKIYSGFQLIGQLINWSSHVFGANPGEQKQIENVTRSSFSYVGHHVV
jgi:hypothetical protein